MRTKTKSALSHSFTLSVTRQGAQLCERLHAQSNTALTARCGRAGVRGRKTEKASDPHRRTHPFSLFSSPSCARAAPRTTSARVRQASGT
jgi:hypothetical protein